MRTLTLLASLMCMALSVSAAKADRRVAFVVGNGTYKNVAQLPNPPIDAKAMAAISGKGDVVDVVTAVAESELALSTLVSVRDKVIAAYEEIMRMPI